LLPLIFVIRIATLSLLLASLVPQLPAQPVTPAKAGLISYTSGKVYIDDRPVERSATHFPNVKENAVVRTEGGRAEVLLAPCMVLRIGENSSFRMIDSRLIDTRIELLTGSAVADIGGTAHHTSLTLLVKQIAVVISRQGTYHISAEPPQLKVFDGRATVQGANQPMAIGAGLMLSLNSAASPQKFDKRDTDSLDEWSRRRSAFLARVLYSQQNRNAQQLSAAASGAATTTPGDPSPFPGETSRTPAMVPPPSPNYFPAGAPTSSVCQAAR
jgi:hypothetical protein